MLLKLLFIIIIFYWGGKIVKGLISPREKMGDTNNKPTATKPLDLSDKDVEDAQYEDIDD